MKELIFGKGLLGPTLIGDKKVIICKYRPEAHNFKKGEIVKGVFKDGLDVLLRITSDTIIEPFIDLNDFAVRASGHRDTQHTFDGLKNHIINYLDLKKEDTAAIICYEVLKVKDIPVASINNYGK